MMHRRYTHLGLPLMGLLLATCSLAFPTASLAQKKLTLEECFGNKAPQFEWIWSASLSPDGNSFIVQPSQKGGYYLGKIDKKGKVTLDSSSLTYGALLSPEGKDVYQLEWVDSKTLGGWAERQYVLFPLGSEGVLKWEIPEGADNTIVSPGAVSLSYNVGETLYARRGEQEWKVADNPGKGFTQGRAVHQKEFGIETGVFWDDKGDRMAFYRMDATMTEEYPGALYEPRPAELKAFRYPMAGKPMHKVKIGIFNTQAPVLGVVWLKTGEPQERYFSNLTWSPDGKFLYIAEVNRGQDTMRLCRYNAMSGELDRVLFTETHKQYVEPLHGPIFLQGGDFLWQSQRTGHNHLYRYDSNGRLRYAVTQGKWDVLEVHGMNANRDEIYVSSNEWNLIGRDLAAIKVVGGGKRRLTDGKGLYKAGKVQGGRWIAQWSSPDNPGGVFVGSLDGKNQKMVYKRKNPFAGYNIPEMERVTLLAADGKTQLFGTVIKPPTWKESGKKHPTVMYVYGGPHLSMVDDSWMHSQPMWMLYMAQEGYVIFTMDPRGACDRGQEFEQVIHRNIGEPQRADFTVGLNYLRKLPFVDSKRVGVMGWSFGGFMTLNMLTRTPNGFKVGVAGGAVTDWNLYEIMYGERYMDQPSENPAGYEKNDMTRYVDKLEGKRLLMLHGMQDDVVVPQHLMRYLRACVKAGRTEVDVFVYPAHEHNVSGKDRVHLYRKMIDYFNTYL